MELEKAKKGKEEWKNEEETQKRREKIKEKRALEETKIRTQRKKTNHVKKKRDAHKEKERLTGIKIKRGTRKKKGKNAQYERCLWEKKNQKKRKLLLFLNFQVLRLSLVISLVSYISRGNVTCW